MMRRLVIGVVVAALLVAQALALAHAVAHFDFGSKSSRFCATGAGDDITATRTVECADAASAHGDASDLFRHHPSTQECRLYDQLAHTDALSGATTSLLSQPVACIAATSGASQVDTYQLASFAARAPPALR